MAKLRWLLVRKAVLRSIAGSFPAVMLLGGNLGACCRSQAQTPLPFQENELLPPKNMNAVEIESAVSDLAAQPFDAAEFPFAFLVS